MKKKWLRSLLVVFSVLLCSIFNMSVTAFASENSFDDQTENCSDYEDNPNENVRTAAEGENTEDAPGGTVEDTAAPESNSDISTGENTENSDERPALDVRYIYLFFIALFLFVLMYLRG